MEFGYSLPDAILGKAGISKTRIYFSGQNLLSFSNLKEMDPETNEENGLGYPTTKILNFGINLSF